MKVRLTIEVTVGDREALQQCFHGQTDDWMTAEEQATIVPALPELVLNALVLLNMTVPPLDMGVEITRRWAEGIDPPARE